MDKGFPALLTYGTPVQPTEGPPLAGKLFHLPQWNQWSDHQRVKFLRDCAESYGQDPRLRQFVIDNVLRHRASRDYQGQAKLILAWVQNNITYYNETKEQLQSPWYTIHKRSGDCDDQSILLGAMFESVKLPWRFVLSGRQGSSGKKLRWIEGTPEPRGVKWSHIYTAVGWPPFQPTQWAYAEGTVKGVPLGWDVVGASSALLPEMNGPKRRAQFGNGMLAAGGSAVAAAVEENGRINWRHIGVAVIAGVLTSVVAQLTLDEIRARRGSSG